MNNSNLYLPGEIVALADKEKLNNLLYYRDDNGIERYRRLVLRRDKSIIPIRGPYIPRIGDQVIGVIADVKFAFYVVEMNIAFSGILPTKFMRGEFQIGQIITATVFEIDESGEITLSNARALKKGSIVRIDPTKIPRVLGKEDTMINMIMKKLNCNIAVGKNGYVWISGNKTPQAINIIKLIESQSHTFGLTNRVEKLLDEITKH